MESAGRGEDQLNRRKRNVVMPSPAQSSQSVPVTADNFTRAESDRPFAGIVQLGGLGEFHHGRELTPLVPLPEPSRAVPNSPVLTPEEFAILRAWDQALMHILAAAERMLRFYAASNSSPPGYDHMQPPPEKSACLPWPAHLA